jgi:RNA polymerase sigma factor (sigma-70 family)
MIGVLGVAPFPNRSNAMPQAAAMEFVKKRRAANRTAEQALNDLAELISAELPELRELKHFRGPGPQVVTRSDLAQDSAMKVLNNLDTFRGTSEKEFWAWVRKIVKNKIADHIDSLNAAQCDVKKVTSIDPGGHSQHGFDPPDPNAVSPSSRLEPSKQEVVTTIQKAALEAVLAFSVKRDQEVIRRHDLQGQTFKEIAAALGQKEDAVGKRHRRAMPKLRKAMAEMLWLALANVNNQIAKNEA